MGYREPVHLFSLMSCNNSFKNHIIQSHDHTSTKSYAKAIKHYDNLILNRMRVTYLELIALNMFLWPKCGILSMFVCL